MPLGVFALLDEECRLPKGDDKSLVDKLEQKFASHASFAPAKRGRDVAYVVSSTLSLFLIHFASITGKVWALQSIISLIRCFMRQTAFWRKTVTNCTLTLKERYVAGTILLFDVFFVSFFFFL